MNQPKKGREGVGMEGGGRNRTASEPSGRRPLSRQTTEAVRRREVGRVNRKERGRGGEERSRGLVQ